MRPYIVLVLLLSGVGCFDPARSMWHTADRVLPWNEVGHETWGLYRRDQTSLRADRPSMNAPGGAYLKSCIAGDSQAVRDGSVAPLSRRSPPLQSVDDLAACGVSNIPPSSIIGIEDKCNAIGRNVTDTGALKKIIYWKLHKVGGSETCALLQRYARERRMSFGKDPDLVHPSKRNVARLDILCAHNAIKNPGWLKLWADHPSTLHIVTFREPVSMAISRFYYQITHSEASHPLYNYVPTIAEARQWFCVFLDRLLYVLEYSPRGYPGTVQLARDELQAASNHSLLTGQVGRLNVLLFERPLESYAVLMSALGDMVLPTVDAAAAAEPRRFVPHPTQSAWPVDAVDEFRHQAEKEGVFDLYSLAMARFEWQLGQLRPGDRCLLLGCIRRRYGANPAMQRAMEQAAVGALPSAAAAAAAAAAAG